MDKILIEDMQFYGYHGLLPEENRLGQPFFVDVELFLNLKKAGTTDNMHDSIDYGHVYEVVKKVVEGEAKNLIEAVAESIAEQLHATFDILEGCMVRVKKPNPPIPGHYKFVAVEIFRGKKDE